jgi:hypothetical protein
MPSSRGRFDLCAGQPAHKQTRVPENTVLDHRERMLDRASTYPHHFWGHPFLHSVQRFLMQVAKILERIAEGIQSGAIKVPK